MDSATRHIAQDAASRAAKRRTGVVVGVLEPDGSRVFGTAGRQGVPDEHSLFEIGSITKVFTATVLAEEVVRGNLSLDQPVRELLPAETVVPTKEGTEITLAHLATDTSGLLRGPVRGPKPWWEFARGRDPYAEVTPDAVLDRLARTRLRRRPGTGSLKYSNFGFGLLGLALMHATGSADHHTLVTERVCRPLGLLDTGVEVAPERILAGHRGRDRPVERWRLTGIAGAGALLSTADDLLTFLAAQLDPASTPLADAIALTHAERLGGRAGIGLGWIRSPQPRLLLWHNGGTGGFRSFAGFVPDRLTAVVALTNHVRGVDRAALGLLRDLDPAR